MKKRTVTLIEVMIVIFLITLITGAIGYNMKGAMDRGKKFRTEQARQQLHDLLLICVDEGKDADKVAEKPEKYLKDLGLAKDPKKLTLDGWNEPFTISVIEGKRDFKISSNNVADEE